MATHSSILALKTPWTEEPGGQRSLVGYSPWSCSQTRLNTHTHTHTHIDLIIGFIFIIPSKNFGYVNLTYQVL